MGLCVFIVFNVTTGALITWNCLPMLYITEERGNNSGAAERKDSSNQLKIVAFL